MKTKLIRIVIASLCWTGSVRGETSKTGISPDRISFYEAPLVCPAAPEIGCGSRAKPILLQLEREQSVAEAWLNRPGTIIAIVWKPETKRKQRAATFKAVSKKEELEARELKGSARRKTLKEFGSRENWHRGSDVDRLSEEEARIIAARLVRRIEAKVSISEEKAKRLRAEFTDLFSRRFTGTQDGDPPNVQERVLGILRSQLDERDVALLKETLPRTLRPLPGEQ